MNYNHDEDPNMEELREMEKNQKDPGTICVYQVMFDANCVLDNGRTVWVPDEINIAGGLDGELVVEKVKQVVYDEAKYGMKVIDFRLRELVCLGEADGI